MWTKNFLWDKKTAVEAIVTKHQREMNSKEEKKFKIEM